MRARILSVFGPVVVALALLVGPAGAASWHFETLDGAGSPYPTASSAPVGYLDSAAVTYGGAPHVFTFGTGTAPVSGLRHGWWTGTTWRFEVLDGTASPYAGHWPNSSIGPHASALVYAGQLHVWYHDFSAASHNLHHAWWNGVTWSFELLDGPNATLAGHVTHSLYSSSGTGRAFLYNGLPHVLYQDPTAQLLRHGWYDAGGWHVETLDGTTAPASPYAGAAQHAGRYADAVVFGGVLHVFTSGDNGGTVFLHHAWYDGTAWRFDIVDGTGSAYAGSISQTVAINGVATTLYGAGPHVWYQELGAARLRHAFWTGATWQHDVVDGSTGVCVGAVNASLGVQPHVVLYAGQPHVFHYRNSAPQALRHAWWDGAAWRCEATDGTGSPYGGASIGDVGNHGVVLLGGQLDAYYEESGGSSKVRHAWYG